MATKLEKFKFTIKQHNEITRILVFAIKKQTYEQQTIEQRMKRVNIFISLTELDVQLLYEFGRYKISPYWIVGQIADRFQTLLGLKAPSTTNREFSRLVHICLLSGRAIKPYTNIYRYKAVGVASITPNKRHIYTLLSEKEKRIAWGVDSAKQLKKRTSKIAKKRSNL